ncbi:hypothetical protein PV08_10613 [Exophiala spinifera]|uniref:Uncharacterized protein n=1 Tax=Exophiala spinifera TaxID=91928 RepID=A0A0D2AX70_9EURO|nr:uncharacterized protein PV08_10613 [Exophiala spinifera]KIW11313.1 hypothetical protein PV08_10613 [Exophiala spinifera]
MRPAKRSPGQKSIEALNPFLFRDKRAFLNINLRPHNLGTQHTPTLDSLRPPNFEYVQRPPGGLLATFGYFFRWLNAYRRFWVACELKARSNQAERQKVWKRLNLKRRRDIAIVSMSAGLSGVPDITRREFQLCMRTHHHWWRRPLGMQLRDLRSILKSYDTYKAEFWSEAHDALTPSGRSLSLLHNLYRSDVMRSCVTPRGRRLFFPCVLTKYIKAYSFSTYWTAAAFLAVSARGMQLRNYEILTDTILILREGGFKRLSAEDIADYCLRSGSPNFLEYIREAVEMDANPVTESMRKFMVPVLEEHARALLDCDWQRIPYNLRWKIEEHVAEEGHKSPESMLYRVWG